MKLIGYTYCEVFTGQTCLGDGYEYIAHRVFTGETRRECEDVLVRIQSYIYTVLRTEYLVRVQMGFVGAWKKFQNICKRFRVLNIIYFCVSLTKIC